MALFDKFKNIFKKETPEILQEIASLPNITEDEPKKVTKKTKTKAKTKKATKKKKKEEKIEVVQMSEFKEMLPEIEEVLTSEIEITNESESEIIEEEVSEDNMDETEYLLSTEANRTRLEEVIEKFEMQEEKIVIEDIIEEKTLFIEGEIEIYDTVVMKPELSNKHYYIKGQYIVVFIDYQSSTITLKSKGVTSLLKYHMSQFLIVKKGS